MGGGGCEGSGDRRAAVILRDLGDGRRLTLFQTFIPMQAVDRREAGSDLKSHFQLIVMADFRWFPAGSPPRPSLHGYRIPGWSNKCWIFKWECLIRQLNNLGALWLTERQINAHLQAAACPKTARQTLTVTATTKPFLQHGTDNPGFLAGSGWWC